VQRLSSASAFAYLDVLGVTAGSNDANDNVAVSEDSHNLGLVLLVEHRKSTATLVLHHLGSFEDGLGAADSCGSGAHEIFSNTRRHDGFFFE
jgi:hypothetical protein